MYQIPSRAILWIIQNFDLFKTKKQVIRCNMFQRNKGVRDNLRSQENYWGVIMRRLDCIHIYRVQLFLGQCGNVNGWQVWWT